MTEKYDVLYEVLTQVFQTGFKLRVFHNIGGVIVLVWLIVSALVCTQLLFAVACLVVAMLHVLSWARQMWLAAEVTEMCQSKDSEGSIFRIAAAQAYKRSFESMPVDARTTHAHFLQHIVMMPIGAKGPVIGLITKEKLMQMGKAAASVLPILLGIRSSVLSSVA
jgi:hypothetical protein